MLDKNEVLTDPQKLVRLELKNKGFDIDTMKVPERVFLLADSLYDAMISRNCGEYKYPLGGKLFVFKENETVGFIKGHMCSPAIATQAEDLIAGGVKELIAKNTIKYRRGNHWTTDAGYRETWGQVIEYREKGALCVEMEGVGLFTIANYRNCVASAMYVVSDVYVEDDWKLGWGENVLEEAATKVIDMIVEAVRK